MSVKQYAQHHSKMTVELNSESKTLNVQQEITLLNQSNDTLTSIVFNGWNNAYYYFKRKFYYLELDGSIC